MTYTGSWLDTCDAALPLQQVVEYEAPEVALLRGEALQVQPDLQLHVLAHRAHALGRLVLAEEVLLAPLEEPEVRLVDLLQHGEGQPPPLLRGGHHIVRLRGLQCTCL